MYCLSLFAEPVYFATKGKDWICPISERETIVLSFQAERELYVPLGN